MQLPDHTLERVRKISTEVDTHVKALLDQKSGNSLMRDMLSYSLGFLDSDLKPVASGGKRYRPVLSLLIAESYGAKEKVRNAALAIELFHNFTLIHDDVEDKDEARRGRPTLWKMWGINHAINAGDLLGLLASETAACAGDTHIVETLFQAFKDVIEGQSMDFALAKEQFDSPNISQESIMLMTEKKTASLFGAATECAGIAANQNDTECKQLRDYGRALGIAYQITDDYRSIWSNFAETGKDAQSDIREKKRTLPIFVAYQESLSKDRIRELYGLERDLLPHEIAETKALIDATTAKAYMLAQLKAQVENARLALQKLSISEESRELLSDVIRIIVPESAH